MIVARLEMLLCGLTAALAAPAVLAQKFPQHRPVIDGEFSEWSDEHVVGHDIPPSKPGEVGIRSLSAIQSGPDLFLYVELQQAINLQGGNDREPGLVVTLGSQERNDLQFDFKNKFPANISSGGREFVEWSDFRFECLPTYASDRFEMKLNFRRATSVSFIPVGPLITINGKQLAPLDKPELNPRKYPFELEPGEAFRIANQNTLHGGLSDWQRQPKFKRLFAAVNADVFCFQEEWDEGKFKQGVAEVLPEHGNRCWHSSCAVVTRHKLTPLDMELDRAAAALVETDSGKKVVVISCHFKCCGYAGSQEDDKGRRRLSKKSGKNHPFWRHTNSFVKKRHSKVVGTVSLLGRSP